jgi:hypothetical protein
MVLDGLLLRRGKYILAPELDSDEQEEPTNKH